MEKSDVATFVTWGAATGAAILAATVWLIAQHAASIHPTAISIYQFEEFRQAHNDFKNQFNERMSRMEQQLQRLETEVKLRSPKSRFYEGIY